MSDHWDVAVVGAGAAGLMTAVMARRAGLSVLLLDGKEKIGAKILMSGGTRCNLTNQVVEDRDFQTDRRPILKAVLAAYSSKEAIQFFEELGIEVVVEEGGKYFPASHSGRTVLEAFLKELDRLEINLQKKCRVKSIQRKDQIFEISGQDFSFQSKTVVIATGGLSFPATGSDGAGYEIAKSVEHSLIETSASLTPLLTDDLLWKSLSGVSLPVRLTLKEGKKKKATYEGSFLFTHVGFSGPVVLNISRHWIRSEADPVLIANFLPSISEEEFNEYFHEVSVQNPKKTVYSVLSEKLPKRFAKVFLEQLSIAENTVLGQLAKKDRVKLIQSLFSLPLRVSGDQGYAKAEVTAGGVDLAEVDKKSLESKKQPGLFFAGEVLDVDGRIGGFNFQWAWSSGVVAARGVQAYLKTDTPH